MRRPPTTAVLLAAACAVLPAALAAQGAAARTTARADAYLRAGRVDDAESLYYAAVTRAPRDPGARLALGRYLAARGALRVGAVLLEEARYFGGDAAVVARELAPVYERLGDYQALTALPASPLAGAARERAAWLRDNPPATGGDDSTTIAFVPAAAGTVGSFRAVLNRHDSLTVVVDPALSGWSFSAAAARGGVRRWGTDGALGTADLRIGGITLNNVALRVEPGAVPPAARGSSRRRPPGATGTALVRVGLDALGAFAPTFDGAAGVLTLRRTGRVTSGRADHLPALLMSGGLHAVTDGRLAPVAEATAPGAAIGGDRRWTYDRRRGEIVVER